MSAAVPKLICDRLMIASIITLLFALHVYGADLNGAWANDPDVCSQIFVRKGEVLVDTRPDPVKALKDRRKAKNEV